MPGGHWTHGAKIANAAAAVTPSDTLDNSTQLPASSMAIYVGTTGNVKVTLYGGTVVTFTSVPAGFYLQGNFKWVWSTGTTASNMVVLYTVGN
jgi:hypothetical protein